VAEAHLLSLVRDRIGEGVADGVQRKMMMSSSTMCPGATTTSVDTKVMMMMMMMMSSYLSFLQAAISKILILEPIIVWRGSGDEEGAHCASSSS
jgi:hypothetical protein